jgi:hypothetical protein
MADSSTNRNYNGFWRIRIRSDAPNPEAEHTKERLQGRVVVRVSAGTSAKAEIVLPRHRNPPDGNGGPNHWECWLRDPDGYMVVLASPDGSADGNWRP